MSMFGIVALFLIGSGCMLLRTLESGERFNYV